MTHEEYVRSVWKHVETNRDVYKGFIFFTANALYRAVNAPTLPELWAKGAEFTRERLEQVRQLEVEALSVQMDADIAREELTKNLWRIADNGNILFCVRQICRYSRIFARLESALATMTQGMKPDVQP